MKKKKGLLKCVMSNVIATAILLCCPLGSLAQKFISENDSTALVEYIDGKQWVYRNIEGLTVGMNNEEFKDDYGKYYQVSLFITNNRNKPLVFNPEKVFADLLSNKGDTVSLEVYTNEMFQKIMKKKQKWAMFLYGFFAGMGSSAAGYSTSYTNTYSPNGYAYSSTTRTYDANAAYQANLAADMQIQTFGKLLDNDRAIKEQGYLKFNTIHPGDAIVGYMNIKHKKGKRLLISLNIGDDKFVYLWDIEKQKKEKKKN